MSSVKPGRIQTIDALRGLCVVLMCLHHLLYDICSFLGAPWWLFTNPVLDVLHYLFAGCFIFISGVSSRFSRSNVKRGLKVIAVALALTGATWLGDWLSERILGYELGIFISFGVLHLLGFCMLFYGLTRKLWDRLSPWLAPLLYLLMTALTAKYVNGVYNTQLRWLFPLGFLYDGFYSADYFPILPWLFVFLTGTWAGGYIRAGRLPERFYSAQVPFFPKVGRHALLIYIVHQPVLAGLTLAVGAVFGIL